MRSVEGEDEAAAVRRRRRRRRGWAPASGRVGTARVLAPPRSSRVGGAPGRRQGASFVGVEGSGEGRRWGRGTVAPIQIQRGSGCVSGLGFAGCGDKEREWGPTWAGLVGPEASWAVAQWGECFFFLSFFLLIFFNVFI